jgi:hypothetical protein
MNAITGEWYRSEPRAVRPFIETRAAEQAVEPSTNTTGALEPKSGSSFKKIFNKKNDLGMGTCAVKVIEKTSDDAYAVPDYRLDCVALIREPRMVVQYYRNWPTGTPATVGVYVADEDIDDILKLSEPPAHSLWDPNSSRLGDLGGVNRDVVATVLRRIGGELKRFQRAASPPTPPKSRRLRILERALASFLSPARAGPDKSVDSGIAPISLQYEREPHAVPAGSSSLKLKADFSVRLKPDAEVEEIDVCVQVNCDAVADRSEKGEAIELATSTSNEDIFAFDLERIEKRPQIFAPLGSRHRELARCRQDLDIQVARYQSRPPPILDSSEDLLFAKRRVDQKHRGAEVAWSPRVKAKTFGQRVRCLILERVDALLDILPTCSVFKPKPGTTRITRSLNLVLPKIAASHEQRLRPSAGVVRSGIGKYGSNTRVR